MNDFEGLFSSDYGFKPQGKSAPMAPKSNPNSNSNSPFNFDIGTTTQSTSPSSSPFFNHHDDVFRPNQNTPIDDFADLGFGGDAFSASDLKSAGGSSSSPVNLDSIFGGGGGGGGGDSGVRFSSLPVFDRPLYDEDVSSSAKYENLFSSSSAKKADSSTDAFEDLLGGLNNKEDRSQGVGVPSFDDLLGGLDKKETRSTGPDIPAFDDLLPGFSDVIGGGTSSTNRTASDAVEKPSPVVDDPFDVLGSTSQPATSSSGIYIDPLEEIGNLNSSGRSFVDNSSSGALFDDADPLDGFANAIPVFAEEITGRETDESRESSIRSPERATKKKIHVEDYQEPPDSIFDMPSYATDSRKSVPHATSTAHGNASFRESSSRGPASPASDENMGSSDDIWLTVSEVPLFTQPTVAPPPSRPPPPRPAQFSREESGSYAQKKAGGDYSSFTGSASYVQRPGAASTDVRGSFATPFDELEDFSIGTNKSNVEGGADAYSGEDFDTNSIAAAAMKEAVDRAEAKFRHARGVRERENAKASKGREALQVEKEEKASQEAQEKAFREQQDRMERQKQQREREEGERRRDEERAAFREQQDKIEREKQQREREEGERRRDEEERRRIEKEHEEKEREKRRIERERELARQAVERASREARERAAIEARVRAERAAVQRAQAEARERAGKAAVQRVQSEARERAAADAKERAEKSAAETREKARAEAREREAHEKAAAAAAASRANQSKTENDFESFFGMGARASSAPKDRTGSSDPFETQFQSKPAPQASRTPVNSSSIRKASSSTNIVDDLSSIFGGPPSAGDFQNVEGETIERRRARLDRHQRTQERAANALAEKNARDLEAQREQEERHRISDTLDAEIKRWSAGKEGNLRALLSTLQYVLWPECGWQPVSLTDLIMGASVKKAYRKATLCIHPDKVQQKGATLQQKYVSEKVFDLLKEAWNKFNSEELF